MYPESTPIVEAARAMDELATVGIHAGMIVANLVLPPEHCTTPYTLARRNMQDKYLAEIETRFRMPILQVPLLAHEVKGIDILSALGDQIFGDPALTSENGTPAPEVIRA